jgi:hypothetical protein
MYTEENPFDREDSCGFEKAPAPPDQMLTGLKRIEQSQSGCGAV